MGELTVAELDDEICSLAARINVATARLLLLVGEFDEREGWAGYGVKSCAHWLSRKCQLGAARLKLDAPFFAIIGRNVQHSPPRCATGKDPRFIRAHDEGVRQHPLPFGLVPSLLK